MSERGNVIIYLDKVKTHGRVIVLASIEQKVYGLMGMGWVCLLALTSEAFTIGECGVSCP